MDADRYYDYESRPQSLASAIEEWKQTLGITLKTINL